MGEVIAANTSNPPEPAKKTPRDPALQSQALANTLATAERLIPSILATPDLLLALAPVGFNEVELNRGLRLFAIAQSKYAARQESLGVATMAMKARDIALKIAKSEFRSYRTVVQVNYREADRANLGANGRIPTDGDKFRTTARSAYNSALQEPYLSVLSAYGFNQERLTAALGILDKLAAAESVHENAQSMAKVATEVRDEAADELKSWMVKLRTIAKDVLRERPALLSLLKD
jgi:hypothetical protein